MTQLREEGWIHHLARHAVACFLTRGDLWVSWEEGLKVFDELLLDADWSVNAGTWLWLSCSSFFQQFFHCYCPVRFGRKADANGDFIRYIVWNSTLSFKDKLSESTCRHSKTFPQDTSTSLGQHQKQFKSQQSASSGRTTLNPCAIMHMCQNWTWNEWNKCTHSWRTTEGLDRFVMVPKKNTNKLWIYRQDQAFHKTFWVRWKKYPKYQARAEDLWVHPTHQTLTAEREDYTTTSCRMNMQTVTICSKCSIFQTTKYRTLHSKGWAPRCCINHHGTCSSSKT